MNLNFDIGMEDLAVVALQELWNQVAISGMKLVMETKDVTLENKSFQEFSKYISELNIIFQAVIAKTVEAKIGSEATRTTLEALDSQLKEACKIIKDYKSGSKFRLLLNSNTLLSQMQDLTRKIGDTVSLLNLTSLDLALNLKSKTDQIINNLRLMEFRSAASTETLMSDIENTMTQSSKNQEHALKLLERIGKAVGTNPNATLVRNELMLLKKEKEEMEARKEEADAFQLSQLIQLLYSTEMVTSPRQEEVENTFPQYLINSFLCPLCNEMMKDPVAIVCGHSFERKAIQEYFEKGEIICPTCKQELPSKELTPNLSLRGSIVEWKKRDMDIKFQAAISGMISDDNDLLNKALEDMQVLMEMPPYRVKVAEMGLIPKFVRVLRDDKLNTKAILKCLYYLSSDSNDYKESIVEAGAIHRIVKRLYRGEVESDALAVLLELSAKETLAEQIGQAKDSIPLLVSLLNNDDTDVSHRAQMVIQNLSDNTHFVIKMAEAGYFKPFIARFNQGPSETRASMATVLTKMQLDEENMKDFEEKHFVHELVQMLLSSSPACKSAGLHCIKKFLAYPKMVKQFLADSATIPNLLGFISFAGSEEQWKQDAIEILKSVVKASHLSDFQTFPGLQELQSQHNVNNFLQAAKSKSRTKVQFLELLVVLSYKSETVRELVRSDKDTVTYLFSVLNGDQHKVRQWAMKLIYCISEDHPAGVPLPPSPEKESAINTLVVILNSSINIKERSIAAGIIGRLPVNDIIIDDILRKSEALKSIQEVINTIDNEHGGTQAVIGQDESLLENALAALLRYTEPTKPELQRELGKLELYPSLVRVLSRGSSLAKQRTAIALAHLSQSTNPSIIDATNKTKQANFMSRLQITRLFPNTSWCLPAIPEHQRLCTVHGSACSPRHTCCLVKIDAVRPLVQTLSDTQSYAAEAALMALQTLLTDCTALSHATAAIVESQGVVAILEVLEKGSISAKNKALELFQKILQHSKITKQLFQRSESILIQLLREDEVRKNAALVLRQMGILPDQSSYF